MRPTFLPARGKAKKKDYLRLIRHCGFGLPDLETAMWSVDNSLTMICEDSLSPFQREGNRKPIYNEMNVHPLPWPLKELESLVEAEVEMRVTLSYFIEPNPSARGVTSKYRYESHGLRFDVKRAQESEKEFRGRLNAAAVEETNNAKNKSTDPEWLIGKNNRHRGSIHSDIWQGSAADLASRGLIGIYPAPGWWKTREKLARYDLSARYSLVVSINAPKIDVDLYTPVAYQIGVPVEIG